MSYSSRVYRQRNSHTHEDGQKKSYFSKKHVSERPEKSNKSVQAKPSVNEPGDNYEREADSVANSLTNQSSKQAAVQKKQAGSIQRLSTPVEDEQLGTNDARMKKDKDIQEKPIQKMDEPKKEEDKGAVQKMGEDKKEEKPEVQKMDEPKKEEDKGAVQKMGDDKKEEKPEVQKMDEPKKEEDKGAVQKMGDDKKEEKPEVQKMDEPKKKKIWRRYLYKRKKPANGSPAVSSAVASAIDQSAGKGKQLPAKALHEMSSGFGVDFSHVRIHNDNEAVAMNNETAGPGVYSWKRYLF